MATRIREILCDPVVLADDPNALAAIRDHHVALAVWRRHVPPALSGAVLESAYHGADDVGVLLDLPVMPPALAASLIAAGHEAMPAAVLAGDIATLCQHFTAIVGCAQVKVRLEVVETDACRRFHADYVTYRLLTTYHGAATQWVHANASDAIEAMQVGDVVIFKGRMLLDEPPILHRSPPIAGTGEKRLLLVIDPVIAD